MVALFPIATAFCLGMMLFIPSLSYVIHKDKLYSYPAQMVDFPKHFAYECRRDKECVVLAEAAYFESRSQGDVGVKAVMQTILNRVEHTRWGNTIPSVVYEGCQFSYTCDGSRKRGIKNTKQWERMLSLAYKVKQGYTSFQIDSTHYHTLNVKPSWRKHYNVVAVIEDHVFYKCEKRC